MSLPPEQWQTIIAKNSAERGYKGKASAISAMNRERLWAVDNRLTCHYSLTQDSGEWLITLTHKTNNWECNCH